MYRAIVILAILSNAVIKIEAFTVVPVDSKQFVCIAGDGNYGSPGKDGLNGYDGKDCIECSKGPQGPAGRKGDCGMKGDDGKLGDKGIHGMVGEKGDNGDAGKNGNDGTPGKKGQPGEQGQKGVTGLKGKDGIKGERGLHGKKGDVGIQGDIGFSGDSGDKGDDGVKGDKGLKGTCEEWKTMVNRVDSLKNQKFSRNWKQCSWEQEECKDNFGNIFTCKFKKKFQNTSLRVYFSGNLGVHCSQCCKRWYFSFNGIKCKSPSTIEGTIHSYPDHYINQLGRYARHRDSSRFNEHFHIEGNCDSIPKGDVEVSFKGDSCGGTGLACIGDHSVLRIYVEEVK